MKTSFLTLALAVAGAFAAQQSPAPAVKNATPATKPVASAPASTTAPKTTAATSTAKKHHRKTVSKSTTATPAAANAAKPVAQSAPTAPVKK